MTELRSPAPGASAHLSDAAFIALPPPRTSGGMPLLDAIRTRHSTRSFETTELPLQEVSNILWAACGHNRDFSGVGIHAEGCRAAPTAHNWQEIDVYVASLHGLHLYDPHRHGLTLVLAQDIRAYTSHPTQPFVVDAPLNLIYVSDREKMFDAELAWDFEVFPWADTAVLVENVYLYCASENLATVCRALFDRPALTQIMGLQPRQIVTFHQLVGYKKRP